MKSAAAALLAYVFATSAPAATVQIDVTGSVDKVAFNTNYTYDGTTLTPVPGYVVTDTQNSVLAVLGPLLSAVQATTGSALFDGFTFNSCSGLLTMLCDGRALQQQPLAAGSLPTSYSSSNSSSFLMLVKSTGLSYMNDRSYSFQDGGLNYIGVGAAGLGVSITGTFSNFAVSQVPLPATAGFLAAGMLGLVALRRRRKA